MPFILYGKGIPAHKSHNPGSHIDILPTLIELVAPKDFNYYSFGKSLLEPKDYAYGFDKIITRDSLYILNSNESAQAIDLKSLVEKNIREVPYLSEYHQWLKLSWDYIVHGDSIHFSLF